MIINQTPYPISFDREISQALTCRYGEEMRQYIFKPDVNVSGLSCLLQIAKPDGTFTENGVEVHTDPDTGECTLVITIPQQATVVKGVAKYSICCYGVVETETHLLYSAEGPLWVDDDLITDEMIQSVAEVNGYTFPQDFVTIDMLSVIIPEALPAEYGYYLRASQDNGDPEWAPVDMPYPGYGLSDAGKCLTVNSDGTDVEWSEISSSSGGHTYSAQEQVVGVWIDGITPVYEKVIQTGIFQGNRDITINHGITNFNQLVSIEGTVHFYDGNFAPIFSYSGGAESAWITVWGFNTTRFFMKTGSAYNGMNILNAVLIIRYTKTT